MARLDWMCLAQCVRRSRFGHVIRTGLWLVILFYKSLRFANPSAADGFCVFSAPVAESMENVFASDVAWACSVIPGKVMSLITIDWKFLWSRIGTLHWRFFAAMGAHRPDVRRLMTKSWRFVARFSCSSGMIGLVSRTPTHGSLQGVSGLQFDVVCGVVSGRQSIPFESCGVAGFTL